MDFLQYTAGHDDDGRRLDRVIRIVLKELPMTEIYKYIRKGLVRVNGKKSECSYRIKKDDLIKIPKISDCQTNTNSQHLSGTQKIQSVFKNSYVLFVNKPYGMAVHGGGSSGTFNLEQLVKEQFKIENSSISFRTGPLHRIDRHTTGLVVFSQNSEGANIFSNMLQNHLVKKEYLTVLCGHLPMKETWIDIITDSPYEESSKTQGFHTMSIINCISSEDNKKIGKKAQTTANPIAYGNYEGIPITLALVEIQTGRKHQIRCQCAQHGYPLLGDTAYKGTNPQSISGHFFLHSWRMSFPSDNKIELPTTITAPLPEKFRFFIRNHLSQCEFSI
ncbi:MAG: RluA family pseudouridine synthase [Treponemataceae bacterium]|nr:RluA family pseudouridine synthase [Treponemataceae bacterium]